ncbi:MAG: hypothetical protein QNJ47_06995 [Nostocaceae cyanobacterium]|nr:hypothetical protein [Nostocaceae cyanobacterium]
MYKQQNKQTTMLEKLVQAVIMTFLLQLLAGLNTTNTNQTQGSIVPTKLKPIVMWLRKQSTIVTRESKNIKKLKLSISNSNKVDWAEKVNTYSLS